MGLINVIRRWEEHAVVDIGTVKEQPLQGVSFAVLNQAAFPLGCHVSRFIEDRRLLTSGVLCLVSSCLVVCIRRCDSKQEWIQ